MMLSVHTYTHTTGAALYTAYRDSDTIFNSKDLVSGVFEYMRRGGGGPSIEVRAGGWDTPVQGRLTHAPVAGMQSWRGHTLATRLLTVLTCKRRRSCSCCGIIMQVSRLQKNVDDLQHALLKSLHDRQPTVIYAGNNKSG